MSDSLPIWKLFTIWIMSTPLLKKKKTFLKFSNTENIHSLNELYFLQSHYYHAEKCQRNLQWTNPLILKFSVLCLVLSGPRGEEGGGTSCRRRPEGRGTGHCREETHFSTEPWGDLGDHMDTNFASLWHLYVYILYVYISWWKRHPVHEPHAHRSNQPEFLFVKETKTTMKMIIT